MGHTQEALAAAVGVSRSSWIRWEQGGMLPEWPEVPRIAAALGVEPVAVAVAWVSSAGTAPLPGSTALGDQVAAECALAWASLDPRQLIVIRWALQAPSLRQGPG